MCILLFLFSLFMYVYIPGIVSVLKSDFETSARTFYSLLILDIACHAKKTTQSRTNDYIRRKKKTDSYLK